MYSVKDIHPFDPFIPVNASKLIIGSIPPHRFCINSNPVKNISEKDVMFYYGSCRNHFWKLVGEACGICFLMKNSEGAVSQRKTFLTEKKTGITDIIYSCRRRNNSSSDTDLFDITYTDISTLLETNPQIQQLIYTSGFIKTCMNRALNSHHETVDVSSRYYKLIIKERIFDVNILYSPSPQALIGMGKDGADIRFEQYISIFK